MSKKKGQKGQQWFDENYSKEKVIVITGGWRSNFTGSLKIESFKNLESISLKKLELTSLEISNCTQLNKVDLSEHSKLTSLSVTGCPNITKVDCSSSEKLTELKVSDLTELKCSNTSIEILSVNLCPGIKILDCSNNDKLINLDISNCTELEFLDCSNSKLTSLDISNCEYLLEEYEQNNNKSKMFKYPSGLKIIQKRITKNLIIIGRTGSGKSTLSNVLTGSEDFEESDCSNSVTMNFQKKGFEWNGKSFNVVDNVGFYNTHLSVNEVWHKIARSFCSTMSEGISQILLVIDDSRFSAAEVDKTFGLLNSIFENDILDYVTIVRTKFSNFKSKKECDAGKKLRNEMMNPRRDIVYVNNPPTNIQITDEEDEEVVIINKKVRERSRKIMLDYLYKTCQDNYFKLKPLDQYVSRLPNNHKIFKVIFPDMRSIFQKIFYRVVS
ncbi:unnamed protein product [Rhizophagus irregularis]|uniref:AIG1-type G domain-containing protein n=1 Tax=Rhizophagus irregularis TaxID=588596 RepID=A0A915ZDL0_9GLOM|nr:unnamed protein product [Rhizophagus irregularis]CAB5370817.1 unnamed protein product [Rhizophagus irregularis]